MFHIYQSEINYGLTIHMIILESYLLLLYVEKLTENLHAIFTVYSPNGTNKMTIRSNLRKYHLVVI